MRFCSRQAPLQHCTPSIGQPCFLLTNASQSCRTMLECMWALKAWYECSCFMRKCRSWIWEMAKLWLHKDQVIATTTEAVNKHIDLVHLEGTQLCMMGQYCSGYQKFRMRKHTRYLSNHLDGRDGRTLTVLDGPRPSRPPSIQVVDSSFKWHGYGNCSMEPSSP